MARFVVSLVALALAAAMIALVLIWLFARPGARGSRERRERVGRRFDLAIGLLGIAIGAMLVSQAALDLRGGEEVRAATWMLLAAGGLLALVHVVMLYAKLVNPRLLYRQLPAPDAGRRAALDARLLRREAVRDALVRFNTIEAIGIYRQDTGAGLAEAKAIVEAMARELAAQAATTLVLRRVGAAHAGAPTAPDRAEQRRLFEQLRGRMVRAGETVAGYEIVEVLARQEPALVMDDTALEFVG